VAPIWIVFPTPAGNSPEIPPVQSCWQNNRLTRRPQCGTNYAGADKVTRRAPKHIDCIVACGLVPGATRGCYSPLVPRAAVCRANDCAPGELLPSTRPDLCAQCWNAIANRGLCPKPESWRFKVVSPLPSPEKPFAVIVPAEKSPEALRVTIAFGLLALVAVVAELATSHQSKSPRAWYRHRRCRRDVRVNDGAVGDLA